MKVPISPQSNMLQSWSELLQVAMGEDPYLDLSNSAPEMIAGMEVVRASRRAMATLFEIMIPAQNPKAQLGVLDGLDLIDQWEERLSIYLEDSEVSLANRYAFEKPVSLSAELYHLLEYATTISRETEGAFDIASGALSRIWGFSQRQGRFPTISERMQAMSRSGMRYVLLNRHQSTVKYLRQGLEINLGAIGKGFALDRAALLLRNKWQIEQGLLHSGNSTILAIGGRIYSPRKFQDHSKNSNTYQNSISPEAAGDLSKQNFLFPYQPLEDNTTPKNRLLHGWPVSLRHPWQNSSSNKNQNLGTIYLQNEALGTSAINFQFFEHEGKKYGHILDPRRGFPAEHVAQVSVIAPSATLADALSTAFYVLGPEKTGIYCKSHPEIAAIILLNQEEHKVDNPSFITFNLKPDHFIPSHKTEYNR